MFQVFPHQKSLIEPGCTTPTTFFKITISIRSSSNNSFLDKFLSIKQENNNNNSNDDNEQHPFQKLFSNESSTTSTAAASWVIFRRFSEILTFHEYLCAKFTALIIPKLQPKSTAERFSAATSAVKAMLVGSLSSSTSPSTSTSASLTTTTTTVATDGSTNTTNSSSNIDVGTLPGVSGDVSSAASSENIVLFFAQLEQLIDYHLRNNNNNNNKNTNILNDSLVQEFLISPRIYFSQSSSSSSSASNIITGFETIGHKLLPKFGASNCFFGENKNRNNGVVQESDGDDNQDENEDQNNNNNNTCGRIPLEFPAIPLFSDSNNDDEDDDVVSNRPEMKFKYGCCQTCVEKMKLICENQKMNNNNNQQTGADAALTATTRVFNSLLNKFTSTLKQVYDATITVAAASTGSSTTMMTSTASFFHLGSSFEASDNNNNSNNNSLLSLKSLPSSIPLSQKSNNNASVKIDYGSALRGNVQVVSNGSLVSISKFEHVKNIIHTLSSPEKEGEEDNNHHHINNSRTVSASPYQTIFCNLINILIASQVSVATMKIHLEKQSLLNINNNNNNSENNNKSSPSYNSITRNIISNLQSISSILGVSENDENRPRNTHQTCDDAIRILQSSILPPTSHHHHHRSSLNVPRLLQSIQLRGIAMLEMFVRVLIKISSSTGMDEEGRFLLLQTAHDEIDKREKGLIVSEMNQVWDFTLERLREREKRMMKKF